MQSLRDKLMGVLQASDIDLGAGFRDDSSLIQSGKLDSLGLFNLALFIEGEIGHEVDMTSFDLPTEWNTVNDILNYIAKVRASS